MASTYYIEGKEQHVRICINRDNLVPPGQPFYCLSAEGLLNTHCCYEDYCNSIDLKVPGEAPSPNIRALSVQQWQCFQSVEFKVITSVSLSFPPTSPNKGGGLVRLRKLLGAGGAGGGDRRAGVPSLCAADGRRVPVPVSSEGLQPQAEAGSRGPIL